MVKKILIAVVALVVVFLAFVAMRPPTFHIERTTQLAAPPEVVFGLVNDFHKWETWSPWEKRDPSLTRKYEGPASGAGAVYSWVGNKDVGEGRMTIVGSRSPEVVDIKLEFLKPFQQTNQALFTFKPTPEGTQITWAMNGTNNFMGKMFSTVMNMDRMIGDDFEAGFANMRKVAEADAKERAKAAQAVAQAEAATVAAGAAGDAGKAAGIGASAAVTGDAGTAGTASAAPDAGAAVAPAGAVPAAPLAAPKE